MARRKRSLSSSSGGGDDLRRHLIAKAENFRHVLTTHFVRVGDEIVLQDIEPGPLRDALWPPGLDGPNPLTSGQAYRFPRSDLPDQHPARMTGLRSDTLELGADNVLRLIG